MCRWLLARHSPWSCHHEGQLKYHIIHPGLVLIYRQGLFSSLLLHFDSLIYLYLLLHQDTLWIPSICIPNSWLVQTCSLYLQLLTTDNNSNSQVAHTCHQELKSYRDGQDDCYIVSEHRHLLQPDSGHTGQPATGCYDGDDVVDVVSTLTATSIKPSGRLKQ